MTVLIIGVILQTALLGALVLFVLFQLYALIIAHRKGAFFVPSNRGRVKTMMELAAVQSGEYALDAGSGDGRIVIAAAEQGAHAVGLEINPFLVWYARWRIRRAGLTPTAEILRQDFRSYSFKDFDTVFLYLLPATVAGLKLKLERELKPGARVVSNSFAIPGWIPEKQEDKIFLYRIPQSIHPA